MHLEMFVSSIHEGGRPDALKFQLEIGLVNKNNQNHKLVYWLSHGLRTRVYISAYYKRGTRVSRSTPSHKLIRAAVA